MKYKLIWRADPHDRTKRKLYATPANDGTLAKSDFMTEKSFNLPEIGAFSISFRCEGVDDKAGFDAGMMIDGANLFFSPTGTGLKKQLRDIHFEQAEDTISKYVLSN